MHFTERVPFSRQTLSTTVKHETEKRRELFEKGRLGFNLPTANFVDIKSAGKTANGGKAT
jgi:hypothetical protein